jgi:hypothetical protein
MVFKTTAPTGTMTERMRIGSSGNVGIGTAAPNTKLDIVGSTAVSSGIVDTLRLRNTGYAAGDGAKIQFSSGTSSYGAGIGSGGVALNSADLRFYTGGNTERMRISSTGVISGDGSGLTGVGASTAYGAVGTYYIGGWLLTNYTHIAGGSTVAGSGIYDEGSSGAVDRRPLKANYGSRTLAGLSGTWRIMTGPIGNYPQDVNATLFVRIA